MDQNNQNTNHNPQIQNVEQNLTTLNPIESNNLPQSQLNSPAPAHTRRLYVLIFLIIFLFLLIPGVVGAYFYLHKENGLIEKPAETPHSTSSPTESQTTTKWNTYVSRDYSFSFEYPPDLQIYPISSEAPKMTVDNAKNLYISDPSSSEPFLTKVIQFDKQIYPVVYDNSIETTVQIKEGYEAKKYSTEQSNFAVYRVFEPYVGHVDITLDTSDTDAMQILRTFRFVNREDPGFVCSSPSLEIKGTIPTKNWTCGNSQNSEELVFLKENLKIRIMKNQPTTICQADCKITSIVGMMSGQAETYSLDDKPVELVGSLSNGLNIYIDYTSTPTLTTQDNAEVSLILKNLRVL